MQTVYPVFKSAPVCSFSKHMKDLLPKCEIVLWQIRGRLEVLFRKLAFGKLRFSEVIMDSYWIWTRSLRLHCKCFLTVRNLVAKWQFITLNKIMDFKRQHGVYQTFSKIRWKKASVSHFDTFPSGLRKEMTLLCWHSCILVANDTKTFSIYM